MSKIMVGVLGVIAVGLAAALVVVSSSASSDNRKQAKAITALQREVDANAAAAKTPTGQPAQIATLKKRITTLEQCIPELTTLVNSMTLDRQSLLISPSSQVSRVCTPTLYGGVVNGE